MWDELSAKLSLKNSFLINFSCGLEEVGEWKRAGFTKVHVKQLSIGN